MLCLHFIVLPPSGQKYKTFTFLILNMLDIALLIFMSYVASCVFYTLNIAFSIIHIEARMLS